jgi:RNA polymerase sigma-70 factor (ECF subfamily)
MIVTMEPPPTMQELLERARGSDPSAFEAAVLRVQPRLDAFIESRLGADLRRFVEPADVHQETFLRGLRSIESFADGGEDEFFRWLCGIARNVLLESSRGRDRGPSMPLELEAVLEATGTTPEARGRRNERFDRLQSALDSLSPDHRQVIILARIERLPMKEVGQRMDRSAEAATQLLWRALLALKQAFGSTESFHLPDRRLVDPGPDGDLGAKDG